jgi:hypothetical protein
MASDIAAHVFPNADRIGHRAHVEVTAMEFLMSLNGSMPVKVTTLPDNCVQITAGSFRTTLDPSDLTARFL